jgi:hypothetical protein
LDVCTVPCGHAGRGGRRDMRPSVRDVATAAPTQRQPPTMVEPGGRASELHRRCQTAPSPERSTPTSYRATGSTTPDKAVGARTRRDHDRTRNNYRRDWGHHDSTSIGDAASVGSAMETGSASASGIGAAEACDGKECCKEQSSHVSPRA